MKNILILSAAMCPAFCALAQPNLTATTTNPVIGDKFYFHECQKSDVSKGAGGANQVWNFHDLKPVNIFTDSTLYVDCSTTPNPSVAGADMAAIVGDGWGYKYYIAASNKLSEVGAIGSGETWNYSDFLSVMMYPMSIDTVVADTFYRNMPLLGETNYGIDNFVGDGFGKLSIPSGDYDNVLRVHITSNFTQGYMASGVPVTASGTTEEYRWYTPGIHSPLLVITYNGNSNGQPSGVYYYMLKPFADAVTDISSYAANVEISPNPASDMVHIGFDSKNSCAVHISFTDMLGRAAGNAKDEYVHSGKSDIGYDVSSLATGIYILRIETPAGSMQRKIQVAR